MLVILNYFLFFWGVGSWTVRLLKQKICKVMLCPDKLWRKIVSGKAFGFYITPTYYGSFHFLFHYHNIAAILPLYSPKVL